VPFSRCTELRLETPVGPKGDESCRLFSPVSAQNPLHCAREVVITTGGEYAAKMVEGSLVPFQKRLLAGVREGAMEGSSTGHAPHAKLIGFLSLPADVGVGFIPVHLRFSTPAIGLGNERLLLD
jgi:hypothetical protein